MRKRRRENPERTREAYRRHYRNNRDKRLAEAKKYREENPEKTKEAFKRWYDANREEQLARAKAYYEANREEVLAKDRARYARNGPRKYDPEERRQAANRRRALKQKTFVADVSFEEICIRDLGVCGICGEQVMEDTPELDHIIPLAAGGAHGPDNVQFAHRTCNRRKSARTDFSLAA